MGELLVVDQAQVPEAAVEHAIERGCARLARPAHARQLGARRRSNPMLVACDSRRRHTPAPVSERAGWRRAGPITVPDLRAQDQLEELAERIKEPDLALEDAVAVFEEGVKLSKGLERDVDRMQGKVEILLGTSTDDEGEEKPELDLFDEESE